MSMRLPTIDRFIPIISFETAPLILGWDARGEISQDTGTSLEQKRNSQSSVYNTRPSSV